MKPIPMEWDPYVIDKEYLLWLIKPEFIRKEGLIILKSHPRRATFPADLEQFIRDHPNDTKRLENTINHVHLSAITENIEMQKKIGEHLIKIWRNKLKSQFPRLGFEVKLKFYNNEWELQLWTKRKSNK